MLPCRTQALAGKLMNFKHIVVNYSRPDAAAAGAISSAGALLSIKAQVSRQKALEARIRALHPYALPEIIAVPVIAGSTGYLDWVTREDTGTAAAAPDSDCARSA